MKERIIIYSIVGLMVVAYFGLLKWADTIETSYAYEFPSKKVKTITKAKYHTKKDSNVTVKVTDGSVKLLPDNTYEFSGDLIYFKDLSKEDSWKDEYKNESLTTKPVFKDNDWIVSMFYTHLDGYPDVISLSVQKKILWNIYAGIGYSVLINPSLFSPSREIKLSLENLSIGLSLTF